VNNFFLVAIALAVPQRANCTHTI